MSPLFGKAASNVLELSCICITAHLAGRVNARPVSGFTLGRTLALRLSGCSHPLIHLPRLPLSVLDSRMPLILILIVLLLVFGGGGYYMGPGVGYYGGGGLSLVLLIVILYLFFGRSRTRL